MAKSFYNTKATERLFAFIFTGAARLGTANGTLSYLILEHRIIRSTGAPKFLSNNDVTNIDQSKGNTENHED